MNNKKPNFTIAGVGSPVVDQVAQVPFSFLEEIGGEKGGMELVDSTGAGDMWAAGFLYGLGRGRNLQQCGGYGALLGAAVVQHEGASLPESEWNLLLNQIGR